MKMNGKVFSSVKNWFQAKENRECLIKLAIAMLLPWVCSLIYCAFQGQSLGRVYLPGSEWNDELFYYKQVEAMIQYGYPQGYFGFNESQALKLSFAAWSPLLLFPWVLWGLLFGWTLQSPILCNLVITSLSMAGFVLLTRISWKKLAALAVLFSFFTPFTRYLLSCTPEIIFFCLILLFYAVAYSEVQKSKAWKFVVLILMGILGTFMRPYLILLLLLPCFLWVKRSKWKGIAGSVVTFGIALLGYAAINHYFAAGYLTELFYTDWIKVFFERGIIGGIRYDLSKLFYALKLFCNYLIEGCRSGANPGAYFAGFIAIILILTWQSVRDFIDWRKEVKSQTEVKTRELFGIELHLLISCIGMLFMILMAYKINEGSRHLLTFIVAGIFVIVLMESKYFVKPVILGILFLGLFVFMAKEPYDYQVPFAQEERVARIERLQDIFHEKVTVDKKNAPSYDNVMIWVLRDNLEKGTNVATTWQLLYAVPEGMGISCCENEYIMTHIDQLKSKYLTSVSGGEIDQMIRQKGRNELYRDEDIVIYQLR